MPRMAGTDPEAGDKHAACEGGETAESAYDIDITKNGRSLLLVGVFGN